LEFSGGIMVKNTDIYKEIEKIENINVSDNAEYRKATLKLQALTVKLLHNLRSNMTAVMDKLGVAKVTPNLERPKQEI
jgi:hypothetical protein